MKNLIIISMLFNICVLAQINPGAKQISLSNSDVALSNDVFSLFNNPAGLAQLNWREVGIYYSPSPFGITELANGYVAYLEPTSFGSLSLGAMTYGFELYRESKLLLSYANRFQKKFFFGFTFNLHTVNIQNYGSDLSYYVNAGVLIYLLDNLRFGFYFDNLNRATFSSDKEQLPTIIKAGFSYDALMDLALNFSIEKDIRYKPSFQFGVDYDLIENLSLRIGFSNNPANYSAGIGINYSLFNLDYAVFSHNDLGITHQFGLIITFEKIISRKKEIKKFIGAHN
jgi:hypothetical protein